MEKAGKLYCFAVYWDVELGSPTFISWFLLVNFIGGWFLMLPWSHRIVSRLFPQGKLLSSIFLYSVLIRKPWAWHCSTVMIFARGLCLMSSSVARIPAQKNILEGRRLLEPGVLGHLQDYETLDVPCVSTQKWGYFTSLVFTCQFIPLWSCLVLCLHLKKGQSLGRLWEWKTNI